MEIIWCQHKPNNRLWWSTAGCLWFITQYIGVWDRADTIFYLHLILNNKFSLFIQLSYLMIDVCLHWTVLLMKVYDNVIVRCDSKRQKCLARLPLFAPQKAGVKVNTHACLSVGLLAQRPYAYLMSVSQSPRSVNGPRCAFSQQERRSLKALESCWPAVHTNCVRSRNTALWKGALLRCVVPLSFTHKSIS